ncbi:type I-E CRISPR-associated protein Cse1/CasA [Nonomuraea sp. CA-143628]|uniref:type I-E CRISPR-associated protein Cse1/CasA n=1 Tax=Nonomuraea sp. CA-143628 TaxID=3239997 RepID=UPI003D928FC4
MQRSEDGLARLGFDLAVQECIPALTKNEPDPVWRSLVGAFAHAEDDIAISHPSSGTEIAVYELLLAICHAAGFTPTRPSMWKSWVEGRRSLEPVVEWLTSPENRGLFDLFDPVRPYGQNRLLADQVAEHGYSPVQLILERAKDYNQFTDHVHLHDREPVLARDAFLAMITQHAYGLGGRTMGSVSGALGRPFTYGSVGRLGARVRILAVGDSVADTLRLNLCPAPQSGTLNTTWTSGTERRRFASTRELRVPEGPADWHSALGRSILLRPRAGLESPDEVVVDRVLMGAGEMITKSPIGDHDAVYLSTRPMQASLSKALWRDAHAIYAASLKSGRTSLFTLVADLDRPLSLLAVGLDAENSKVRGWVRDMFPYNPLRADELRNAAEHGVKLADEAVQAIQRAAATACRYAYPARSRENTKALTGRFDASDEVWARAGAPFHHLLREVANGASHVASLRTHATTMRAVAVGALDERLRALPPNTRGWRAVVQARQELLDQLARKTTFKTYSE